MAVQQHASAQQRSTGVDAPAISDRDRKILDFEQQWWDFASSKDQGIQDLFGLTTTQYYQRLNYLIDQEGALAYAPLLVKRLRRLRGQRTHSRSPRVLGLN